MERRPVPDQSGGGEVSGLEWLEEAKAPCGHEDLLGFFAATPCKECIVVEAQRVGLFPVPLPEPPF